MTDDLIKRLRAAHLPYGLHVEAADRIEALEAESLRYSKAMPAAEAAAWAACDAEPDLYRVGKARAGRLLDGREWNELPKMEDRDNG